MSASSPLSELAGTSPGCDPAVHSFRSALVWSHSPLVWECTGLGTPSCSHWVLQEVPAAWGWHLDPGLGSLGLNLKQNLAVELGDEHTVFCSRKCRLGRRYLFRLFLKGRG